MDRLDPHPVTGQPFASPVPPGTGWPGDPADLATPVARTPAAVRRLAATLLIAADAANVLIDGGGHGASVRAAA